MKNGIVYLVGAGPGDPGLITLRGLEYLKQADVVVYDRLANHSLLTYASHAELINVGKQPHCHTMPQAEINALLIEKAQAGNIVVRLKGGDPFVFGRGGEEAIALAEAGLPFEVIPGVTSAIAAPAYAGIPVTHRGMACSVTIATGHRADFFEDPACDWKHLACSSDTLVFLMGVYNLPRIVEQLIAHGRSPDTPVALVERATRTNQKTVVGTLADIVERAAEIRPPAVIVIGEVVRFRESLRWFDLHTRRPLLGLRILNTSPLAQAREFSGRLMALGAEPVELPTSQVVPATDSAPLDAALNRLGSARTSGVPAAGSQTQPDGPARAFENGPAYDWIFFPDADGVAFFINRLFALGHDVRALAGVKLAVADRSTAEALLEYGLVADFIPVRHTVRDGLANQRVLLPCSETASSGSPVTTTGLMDALGDQGALVETVAAYALEPANLNQETLAALLDGKVDVAAFTNSSNLTSLAKILNRRSAADLLSPLTVACLNPAIAEAARALGVRVDVIAEEHSIEGLVEALVKWHNKRRAQCHEPL